MICPYCSKQISIWNKKLNSGRKPPKCPYCSEPVTASLDILMTFIIGAPIIVAGTLIKVLFFPESHLMSSITVGIAILAGFMYGYKLKRPKDKDPKS